MVDVPHKCFIIAAYPKPKVFKGVWYPEDMCGTYGRRKKSGFAVPLSVKPYITEIESRRSQPFFMVDPLTALAQPIGTSTLNIIENWYKNKEDQPVAVLQSALEVAMNKRYVKSMTLKVRDTIETLIVMAAGGGIFLLALHLVGQFTGHPIAIAIAGIL